MLRDYGLPCQPPFEVAVGRNVCVFAGDGHGHRLVVKLERGAPGAQTVAGLSPIMREGLAYLLAQGVPAIRERIPACYLHDRQRGVLVLEDLRPAAAATKPDARWAARVGEALAAIHEATADLGQLPAESRPAPCEDGPPIPDLSSISAEVYAELSPAEIDVVRELQSCEQALVGLRALRHAWSEQCLVHGDVRLANVLVSNDRTWLVDWECACAGDPAFDLGGAAADILAAGPRTSAGALSALVAAYRTVRPAPSSARVLAYAGAWLVHRITSECRGLTTLGPRTRIRVELAKAALSAPAQLAAELGLDG